VRSLDVSCWECHHRTILSADLWPDHTPVPSFRARMVRSGCGTIGADVQPNRRSSRRERRRHTTRHSDQQCGPKSGRRTAMPLARSRGAVQIPVERT
jgi:hypothetical protein